MHKTHMPLTLWFWAAYLVSTHGPGISALQLQRQLGISRYETAWMILHKLRRAMVAPERELLTAEVEVDEGFLGGRDTDLRGGRQRNGKPLVGVAVEVRGNGSGRLRLQLLPDASGASENLCTRFSLVVLVGLGSGRGRRRGIRTSRPSVVSSCFRGF